jgi:structural maintenance of chromosome 3 (chondroitin sulfate proteoglycan 6)
MCYISLFHVVVDTEDTATHLLNIMSKEKSGRITFIPLNRVKPRTVEYPQKDDAVPLLSQLEFDQKYQLAFQQVFGGVILCRTLEVASSYAKSYQLTVVTAEGNRVDGRGAMTGGYIDAKRSRLSAAKKFRQWQVQADTEKERQQQMKQQLLQLDQKVTRLVSALQVVEAKKKKLAFLEDAQTAEVKLRKEEDLIKSAVLQKTRALENIRVHGQLLEKQLVSYQQELATEPTQLLVAEEQQVLKRNAEVLEQLSQKLTETRQQKSQVNVFIDCYKRKRVKLMYQIARRTYSIVTR